MTEPKPCGKPVANMPTLLCAEPKFRLPKGTLAGACYWHSLDRRPMEFQVREAVRRLAEIPEASRRARVPAESWPSGKRWCAGCQTMIPLWYCRGSRCRADDYSARRENRNENVYGLGPEGFAGLMEKQGGRCAICGNRSLDRAIATDHNHKTGETRGLLCKRCNHDLLGAAFDSVAILRAAVYYLENPPASSDWNIDDRNAFAQASATARREARDAES